MGGRAGGANGGMGSGSRGGGMTRSDVIAKYPELMTKVKDAAVRDELIEGIQYMEKEFGVTPNSIKFVNRTNNQAGYQTFLAETGINLKYLGDSAQSKKIYAGGYHPVGTEKNPAKATMVHELAHKLAWKSGGAFHKELDAQYKSFISGYSQGKAKNPTAHSLGRYSTTDKHEFFSEALSAYNSGLKNQYTTAAYKLAKKYSK